MLVSLVYLSGFSSGNVLDFEEYVTLERVPVQFLVTVASALLRKRKGAMSPPRGTHLFSSESRTSLPH